MSSIFGNRNVRIDPVSEAIVFSNHQHTEIHEGETFRYFDSITLGSGVSQDYLFTTPNTTKRSHLLLRVDGTAITTFYIYEASDRTGTTLQTAINADRNSETTATSTIHKGTSGGTTDGTQLMIYSSGTSTNQSKSESSMESREEWIMKQNTKYIFRITSGTAGNLCNIQIAWYEHTSPA